MYVPPFSAAAILEGKIRSRAATLSLPVASDAETEVLQQRVLRAASLASAIEAAPARTTKTDNTPHLDSVRPGVLVSHYAVIIGSLGDDFNAAEQAFQAAEYHAAVALSWLTAKYREDLHLFLVGPPASNEEPTWVDLASRLERDERICRKLVWLPPRANAEASAEAFLERTFLARPWEVLKNPNQPRLDPIEDVVNMLSGRQDLLDIPQSALREWLSVLTHPGELPDVVLPLIRALEGGKS